MKQVTVIKIDNRMEIKGSEIWANLIFSCNHGMKKCMLRDGKPTGEQCSVGDIIDCPNCVNPKLKFELPFPEHSHSIPPSSDFNCHRCELERAIGQLNGGRDWEALPSTTNELITKHRKEYGTIIANNRLLTDKEKVELISEYGLISPK